MSEEPGLILDYASPRPRGGVRAARLPARSKLTIDQSDGAVRVTESLEGQGAAIAAIAFALFVMAVMLPLFLGLKPRRDAGAFVCLGPFWLSMATLIPCVINSTWRRTVIDVNRESLRIRVGAPLWGRRNFEWAGDRVASVEALQWADGSRMAAAIARVIVTIRDGKPVVLFSGHDLRELLWIAGLVRDTMGWDASGVQRGTGL